MVVRRLEQDVGTRLEQQRLLLEIAADDERVGSRAQRGDELPAHLQRRPSVRRRLLGLRQVARELDDVSQAII